MMCKSNNNKFNILSLDGGGVRGVFSAQLLDSIDSQLGIDIYKTFDLIVGTSTGSIVAAYVATRGDMSELVKEFEQNASKIFAPQFLSHGYFKSRYRSSNLESFLKDKFGSLKLGQIDKPLIINASNASTGEVHLFKSAYQEKLRNGDYFRDGEVYLYKAIQASCSAPTYFDPVEMSGDLLCDGGIWANNPSVVGYVDAIRNFNRPHESIRVFSVGTGKIDKFYLPSKRWGLLTGWQQSKIVDFAMLCQTQYAENCMKLILRENFFRINPSIKDWGLDNFKPIPTLKSIANNKAMNLAEEIRRFLTPEIKMEDEL